MIAPGKRIGFVLLVAAGVLIPWRATEAEGLSEAIDAIIRVNNASAQVQKRIDKLSEQTGDLLHQFREVQRQLESVRVYNAQVETLVNAQREEIADLENQIEKATTIGRDVMPLMKRMIEGLEDFVELDVPFLPNERKNRLENLRKMMDRADVVDSEKFRQILEAYQIENEYGRTVEAYQGDLTLEGKQLRVDFLRVGRIALIYSTRDGRTLGFWNKNKKAWQALGPEYRSSIKEGLRIARKTTAPNLIRLPILAAEDAS